jgi:hypothetical protein
MTPEVTRSRPFGLVPGRHVEGLGGTYDVLISVVTLVAGCALLVRGDLWGIIFILACLYCARNAYLKYQAGNWP